MRPIRLEFAGLQSYREAQVIDFSDLLGGGLFGIFGPTGSGKSTILDAITLALYGRVSRAKGTAGTMNTAEKRLQVKFSFALQGGGNYRVERSYKRERETEAIRTEHCRLIEVVGEVETVLADKEGDVSAKVMEILGLTLADFTKAVVLPQGQFAEFLSLGDSDRRKMLQRIFNLTQYGDKLAERLKARLEAVKSQLAAVQAEQVGLGAASAEAVAEAQARWDAAQAQVTAAEEALRTFEAEYGVMAQVWVWQEESVQVKADLVTWQARASEAQGWRTEFTAAGRAEQVRPHLKAEQQARTLTQAAEERFSKATTALTLTKETARIAFADYQRAQQRKKQDEPHLTERRVQLQRAVKLEESLTEHRAKVTDLAERVAKGRNMAAEAAKQVQGAQTGLTANSSQETDARQQMTALTIDADHRSAIGQARRALDRLSEAVRARGAAEQRVTTRQTACSKANQEQERAEAEAAHAQGRLTELDQILVKLQQEKPAVEDELRAQEEWLSRADEQVRSLTGVAELLTQRQAEQQRFTAEALRLGALAEKAAAAEVAAQAQAGEARQRQVQAQGALDAVRSQEHALALVESLASGEPCPVCGSTHHPSPAAPTEGFDLTEALAAVQAADFALQKAHTALMSASEGRAKAEGQAENGRARQTEAEAATVQAADQLTAARTRLPGVYQQMELQALPAALSAERAEQKARRERYQAWQRQLEEQRSEYEVRKSTEAKAGAKVLAAQATLQAETTALTEAVAELEQRTQEERVQAAAFDAVRDQYEASTLTVEEERIVLADKELAALQRGLDKLLAARQSLETALAQARSDQERYTQLLQQRELDLAQANQSLTDTEGEWRVLTGSQPAAPQLSTVQATLHDLEQAESKAGALREKSEAARSQAETEWAGAQSQQEIGARRLAEAEQALRDALTTSAFATSAAADTALRSPERRGELEQLIATYDREGDRLQTRQDQLTAQLAGRSLSADQWQGWGEQLKRTRDELNVLREEMGRTAQALQERQSRQQRWQELEAQRITQSTNANHLEDLRTLLRGNAFVDFLAQDQMIRVAAEASARLSQLTRARYALETEPAGGFIIRDDGNGGTRRSVSTLSGGETFLTSLALALALSAQIQLRGHYPLEFFFLDEGFGTLDPDLLDVVITTLERLELEKLHVGVISHVPELRSRLQRRVIVESAEPGGRGSRVRLERA